MPKKAEAPKRRGRPVITIPCAHCHKKFSTADRWHHEPYCSENPNRKDPAKMPKRYNRATRKRIA